jgi:hypothetical protein
MRGCVEGGYGFFYRTEGAASKSERTTLAEIIEELISANHQVFDYPLPFLREMLSAYYKRKMREWKEFVHLVKLAVWGSKEDIKSVFGGEEEGIEELLEEFGDGGK